MSFGTKLKNAEKIARIGALAGFSGIIIMSFGASLGNLWMLRGGAVLTTFGVWFIQWAR